MEQMRIKQYFGMLAAGLSLMALSGCFSSGEPKKDATLYIINVLDKTFFDDCHIPGSLNIPMQDVTKKAAQWSKKADVVVYCSNYACGASAHVCKKLQEVGFESAWEYDAGMAGWYQAHLKDPKAYPVVGPCKQGYLTMENKPTGSEEGQEHGVKVITTEKLKVLIDEHQKSAS